MKIKGIFAVCKKNKQVILFNRYNNDGETVEQYISDGYAVYPLSGLPVLDEESILTIFDVPEKQREDWRVECKPVPEGINFRDTDNGERIIEKQGDIAVAYAGKTLKPLQTHHGLIFIEGRYLAPVSDVLDVMELYERRMQSGQSYIVAKAGFMLQAVIMPYDAISAAFVDKLEALSRQCALALAAKENRERAADEAAEAEAEDAGQTMFDVDPETGEIIEESEAAEA